MGVLVAIVASCGGGDDDASPFGLGDGDEIADAGAAGENGGSAVILGDPVLSAAPGQVWVEVGGERLEYTTNGSLYVECTITSEQVVVNLQTADGQDFLLQGSDQAGDWFVNMTFSTAGGESNRYSSESASASGTYTIGDGALSYEGTVVEVVGFDVENAEDLDARLAVNCASPGGDPTATVGGETYTFPFSGAQSVQCEVASEAIDIEVNRLATEGLQLGIDVRIQNGEWLGTITVYRSEGNLSSPIPPDGTGLTVDGTSVSYMGTFEGPDGAQLDGTVEVTC